MITSKAARLVEILYDRTLNDKIKWEQTIEIGVYQIAFPTVTVKIFERIDSDTESDIVIQLFNENAEKVEEITDNDLSHFFGYGSSEGYGYMNTLYNKARSQAMGVEKLINELLEQLGEEKNNKSGDEIPF